MINHRGLAGCPLKTPKLYCGSTFQDILEPIEHYTEIFKRENRKCFAVSFSMGSALLGNMLGFLKDRKILDGACVVQSPIQMWESYKSLEESIGGFYNRALGKNSLKLWLEHEEMLNLEIE